MDRETIVRTIIAGVIILAMMMLWSPVSHYFWPEQPAPKSTAPAAGKTAPKAGGTSATLTSASRTSASGTSATGSSASGTSASGTSATGTTAAEKPPELKASLLAVEPARTSAAPAVFGSATSTGAYDLEGEAAVRGGGLQRLTLSRRDFFKTVEDRYLPVDERAAMNLIDPTPPPPSLALAMTIPELRVHLKALDAWTNVVNLADVDWNVDTKRTGPTEAAFWVNLNDGDGKPLLTVRKCFVLKPREAPAAGEKQQPQYEMKLVIEFVPADERVDKVDYTLQGPLAMPQEGTSRQDFRQVGAGTWSGQTVQVAQLAGSGIKKAAEAPAEAPPTKSLGGSELAWAGQVNKYFAIIMIPQKPVAPPGRTFAGGAEAVQYTVKEGGQPVLLAAVQVLVKDLDVAKPESRTNEYAVFAGPKDPDILEQGEYGRLELPKLITWASACCFVPLPGLQEIGHGLVLVLLAMHAVVLNYGLAIILLVVLLKAALHPVTRWSYRSMSEMQRLAPKMQEIREKHKDDPARMREEMAKMGGAHKMFSGCLPMFVQMPIWIGLYGALSAAIQLRHASFLPADWLPAGSMFLQDLAAPDAMFHWQTPFFLPGHDVPILGMIIGWLQGMLAGSAGAGVTEFNILPIFMGVAMYLQQKLTPQPTATTPQAEQQKKMMSYMMVFFTVLLYSAPSGLCLYIATSSFLGFFEQRHLRNKMALATAAAEAAAAADVPPPSAARVSRASGREKGLAERIRGWVEQKLDTAKKKAEEQQRKKRKR
jgi:YidC/Oxa1 family membrane protein insertase